MHFLADVTWHAIWLWTWHATVSCLPIPLQSGLTRWARSWHLEVHVFVAPLCHGSCTMHITNILARCHIPEPRLSCVLWCANVMRSISIVISTIHGWYIRACCTFQKWTITQVCSGTCQPPVAKAHLHHTSVVSLNPHVYTEDAADLQC